MLEPGAPDLQLVGRFSGSGRPAPAWVLDAVERWFRVRHGLQLSQLTREAAANGAERLTFKLHPNGCGVCFQVSPDLQVRVEAHTHSVGPGFTVYLGRSLRRLGVELSLVWDEAPLIDPRAASERAQQRLLEDDRRVVDQLAVDERFPHLLLPGCHRFQHNSLVATPLGPRGMAWLAGAAVGSLRLDEAFPWATPGLGPRVSLGRALTLMWTQVRWREPQDEAERALLIEVDRLLAEAHDGEPNLDLPWSEWADLQSLGDLRTEHSEVVHRRGETSTSWPPIGYRRRPVDVRQPQGWWLRLPGSMAEGWSADGSYSAWEGPRRLDLRVVEGDAPQLAAGISAGPAGTQLVHRGDGVAGTAQLLDAHPSDGGFRLVGRVTGPASTALITASFQAAADRYWAESAWRSLHLEPRRGRVAAVG